ncbi:MAG: DUF4349 domain-containing protein [Clostridia bacterium]|nr:DUF4349 domain-containing protein [Clostridia bacterium]
MKKAVLTISALLICLCMLTVGCARSAMNLSGSDAYAEEAQYAPMPGAAFNNEKDSDSVDSAADKVNSVLADRKVIKNADLTIQTLEFDSFISAVIDKTNELGGYVQNNDTSGKGYGYSGNLRSADMTVRIPAEKYGEFLSSVDGLGNIIRRNESVKDVTDSYVDTEARLSSIKTEYQTLLDLLSKAETLDDIIKLQDRLSDVRYEMEALESTLNNYDKQVALSTIEMDIREVERQTTAEKESFGDEVSRRFNESLEDVGFGFTRFAAWFIGNLPVLLVMLFFLVALPLIIVFICLKAAKKRRIKRQAAEAERHAKSASATVEPNNSQKK